MIIDTHTHYHHRRFDSDRKAVLEKIHRAGVSKVIEVPISYESNKAVLNLAQEYSWVYPAVGLHPNQTVLHEHSEMDGMIDGLRAMGSSATAFGEIGLDYKRVTDDADRAYQRIWFERLLTLSIELNKPIILHVREAAADAIDILRSFNRSFCGVVHCYSEDKAISKQYMDMGFALGFGGSITYETTGNVREAIRYAPIDMLLPETDAPFLTPTFGEGKNTSLSIPAVVYRAAKLRGETYGYLLGETAKNAHRIFGI